jgi:hypothetical protein
MEFWLIGLVLIWLGIISYFDLRKREIPHSAWVALPWLAAMMFRLLEGGWQLVLLSAMVALVSERKRLAEATHLPLDEWGIWIPPLFLFSYWALLANPVGALSILGFWLTWELHGWGGADAVASITLVLLWPAMAFVIALLGVHLVAALGSTVYGLIHEKRWRLHSLPGLPLILATVLVFLILRGVAVWSI